MCDALTQEAGYVALYWVPLKHVEKDAQGRPVAFTWRGVTYRGKIISTWWLSDRWWEREVQSDCTYYRLMTADFQTFDIYGENHGDSQRPNFSRLELSIPPAC